MNVARTILDCLVKDKIDKPNDGRCIGLRFNRSGLFVPSQLQKLASFTELFEDLLHARCVSAVILLDALFDLIGSRNHNLNVFAEGESKVLRCAQVERVNERHTQQTAAHFNRKRAMQAG